jgi:hypothetical protein
MCIGARDLALDGAVRPVADPAVESELQRAVASGLAEEHALDPARDHEAI